MRRWRLTVVLTVAILTGPASQVPGQPAPRATTPTPTGPVLRLGALLPLAGPGAWFGAEIKQGLELAVAELDPAKGGGLSTAPGAPESATGPAGAGESKAKPQPRAPAPEPSSGAGAEPATSAPAKDRGRPTAEAIEPEDRPRTVALVLQAVDVQPLDVKDAETEVTKLLSSGVAAIVTASPTPTLTVYPLATARNVLVIHAGLATERIPAESRTLLQLRPSPAIRADVLSARAWDRGIRRLAVLVGSDPFGRAVRAAVAARWRQLGGHLAHEESLSLDASDLRSRLRALARNAPEAVVLGFQGTALGEAARALRDAGYAGQLMAMDDDRAALLVGGKALDGALLLTDAFVPLPGSRGDRFARAYEAKYTQPPSRFAANAYEVGTLLTQVAQRLLDEGRGLGGTRLREALGGGRFQSLYAGELVVREDGTVTRPLAQFRVEGERAVFQTYVGQDGRAVGAPQGSNP